MSNTIMDMSPRDLMLLSDFAKLAEEATKAEATISEHFATAFGVGKQEIHVYHTEAHGEYYGDGYLHIDGTFRYSDNWWGGREWKVRCTADGIFKVYRSYYLESKGLEYLIPKTDKDLSNFASHFRNFIAQLENN